MQPASSHPAAARQARGARRPLRPPCQTAMADLFTALPEQVPARAAPENRRPLPAATRPHQDCYWVVPGTLLAGEHPGAGNPVATQARLAMLAAAGVRHFVDLTEAHELAPYHALLPMVSRGLDRPVAHERLGIRDVDVPHCAAHANRILDRIDALVAVNAVPYVHCRGGIGRTGTIVACWLVRHGKSGAEALAIVAEHWNTVAKRIRHPRSPETEAQRRYALDWARHDRLRAGRA